MTEAANKGVRAKTRVRVQGHRGRLNVQGKDPAFEYRIVNDSEEGQRVQQFLDAGWEIDTSKQIKIGENRVNKASAEGTPNQISVGGGLKAYLMRIPKEFYDEDQAIKLQEIDEFEKAIKPDGTYGSVSQTVGHKDPTRR